ncbi:alpha/beta hydrolase [Arcticibacterium luteifluviistationis]|uniref:Esterase n=1 Tax=Arcticibacterium luteifluviistationis TaxID=1784714 RepID=A0A2Z4G7J4_9BACT|nr:alpha/beta hydrolase-fold protein [Arcticibacterium luteifluviistationis]AWV97028.1 esterase [Arcticibacterium luteifluviistationis]
MKLFKGQEVFSKRLNRKFIYDVVVPPNYSKEQAYPLLVMNDGQDFEKLKMESVLEKFWKEGGSPFIFLGLHCNQERLAEYGTAGILDSKGRGAKAAVFKNFLLEVLIPLVSKNYKLEKSGHVFCGFSLGGLSAFDIVWETSGVFDKVGVFSGALWWRSTDYGKNYDNEKHRIIHEKVKSGAYKPNLKFWFECGTDDEKSDRDNNGVIDSIDDTRDLIKELMKKGYEPNKDIAYVEIDGGKHNQATWSKAMPGFLKWAFGTKKTP